MRAASEDHKGDLETGYVPFRDSISPGLKAAGVNNYKYHLEVNTFSHFADINRSRIPAYETTNFGEDQRVKLGVMVKLHNVKSPLKLIVAPGNHCNWSSDDTVNPGNSFNITAEQIRWYDYWLKGIKNGIMDEPPVYLYTYNAPANKAWQFAWQWPLPTQKNVNYYFGPGSTDAAAAGGVNSGSLGTAAPTSAGANDNFTVDYSVTAANRNQKGMTYTTPVLAADSTMTGHPVVHLWVSTTATDGDFLAFLADVAPDGKVTPLPGTEDGKLRASHRALNAAPYDNLGLPYHRSFAADVKPLTPGEPVELVFDMAPISYVFKAGHRIRLIIANVEVPRHAGAAPPTQLLSPPPVVTYYRDVTRSSYIAMPVNAAVSAAVRIVPGKTTVAAHISFPKTLYSRYIKDVKIGSIKCNGVAATSTKLAGDILVAECSASGLERGATVAVQGEFGSKYYYGDLMTFNGVGTVPR
jgi:predicted acyl esterase